MSDEPEHVLVFRHEMPRSWHILSPLGSALCLFGAFTGEPYLTLPGLVITLPCIVWYVVSRWRTKRLGQRLQGDAPQELW